jgi:hypothetical protein
MPKFIFPDGSSVQIPEGVDPAVATRNIIKQFAGKHGLPEDAGEKAGWMGDLKSAGISGASAVFDQVPGVVRALVGGDWNNPQLQNYRYRTQTYAPSLERASTTKMRELATEAIEKKEKEGGISAGALEAIKQYGGSRLGVFSAVQSLPGMLASAGIGGLLGRGATAVLPSLAGRKAGISVAGAVGGESALEGAEAATGTYDAVFEEAIKRGFSKEDANRIASEAAKKSGAASAGVTATLGALPIPSAEKLLAGRMAGRVPGGRLSTAGLGALGEIPTEMTQAATGSIGTQRGLQELIPEEERATEQLLKGVGGAMGQAAVGAGMIGGGAGFLSGGRRPEAPVAPPAPTTEAPPPPAEPGQPPLPSTPSAPPTGGPAVPPPPAVVMTPAERQAQKAAYQAQIAGLTPEQITAIKAEIGGKLNNKTPSIANLEAVGEILKKYQPQGETNAPGTAATNDTGTGTGSGVAGVPAGVPPAGEVVPSTPGTLGGTNVPPEQPTGGAGAVQPPLTPTEEIQPGEEPVDFDTEAENLRQKYLAAKERLPQLEQEYAAKMKFLQEEASKATNQTELDPIEERMRTERKNYQAERGVLTDDINSYRDKFKEAVGGVEKSQFSGELQGRQSPQAESAVTAKDYPSLIKALKQSPNRFARWVANKAEGISGIRIDNTNLTNALGSFRYAPGEVRTPEARRLNLAKSHRGAEHTLTHELVHAVTSEILREPNASQKPVVKSLEKLFAAVKNQIKGEYAATNVREFVAEGLSNPEFQLKLMAIPYENTSAWGKFTQLVGNLLGIRPEDKSAFTELINLTEQLSQEKAKEEAALKGTVQEPLTKKVKTVTDKSAPAPKKPRSPAQQAAAQRMKEAGAARRAEKKAAKEAEAQRKAANLVAPEKKWIDDIRRKFQNVQIGLYNLSDAVKEKLGGILPANLDLASALSLGKGEQAANFENNAGKLERRYVVAVKNFMKATKLSVGEATRQLSNYLLALHELERRIAIYYEKRATLTDENDASRTFLRSAIVANDKELAKLKKDFKADIKTAEQQRVYDVVENSRDRAKDLYQEIINIVNNDPIAKNLDFNATTYDVVAYEGVNGEELKMTPQARDQIIAEMEAKFSDAKVQAAVAEAVKVQQALDKAIQKMNKAGDYTPKGAARLMEARGWQNYVPQRGKQKEDSDFEYYGESGGSGLAQSESALGGRGSLADNVITRSISEAKKAAGRAPGNRIATIIRNYVDEGYIKGKISKTPLTTLDNYVLGKNANRGDDIILYRDPEGDIYEVKIDDPNIAAAIQGKTHELIPIAQPFSDATMLMAQTNTRFNPMFWLKNFFVDPLTNTFIIASEQGFKAAGQYASRVVSDLWDNKGTTKAMNFMRLYAKGELEQIGELATKDAWYRDALEFVNIGGKVSYLSGLRNETQMDEMYKKLGPGKVIRNVEQLAAFVDPITEGLELALRVSAFRTAKTFPEFEGDARKAAAYSKDLANFEQIGQWGKWMGAWFMFSRPSATGASRLYDALSKGKYAKQTVLTSAAIGSSVYFLSMLMGGDDDEGRNRAEHDDPSRWVRNWRLFIPGYESPIQIPWGFGFGSIGAASAQLSMFLFGKSTAKEFAGNMKTIAAETAGLPVSQMSFLENPFAFLLDSITPSVAKPLLQMVADVDSLERPVFNKGQSKYVGAYMGGENIPESVKQISEAMFDTFKEVLPASALKGLSADGLHFIANSYLGGVYRTIGQMDSSLRATGIFTENEQKDINAVKATLLLSGFVGTAANYDARKYYEVRDEIEQYKKVLRTYKDQAPEKYADYKDEYPGRERAVKYFEKQESSVLRDLQEQRNKLRIRYKDSPKEREEALKENRERQNDVMRRMVERTRDLLEE